MGFGALNFMTSHGIQNISLFSVDLFAPLKINRTAEYHKSVLKTEAMPQIRIRADGHRRWQLCSFLLEYLHDNNLSSTYLNSTAAEKRKVIRYGKRNNLIVVACKLLYCFLPSIWRICMYLDVYLYQQRLHFKIAKAYATILLLQLSFPKGSVPRKI